jgi:hypothetical protein
MEPDAHTRYCPTCGTPTERDFRFCKQCGTPLPGGATEPSGGRAWWWVIGIVCLVVVLALVGAAILSHRDDSKSSDQGIPTQPCDLKRLKFNVWLRAGPDGVDDGYELGSPVPCRLKKALTLSVSVRTADGHHLPSSLAGFEDQEIISGPLGVSLAPGLPPISDRSSSLSPREDWCRVPFKQPWTLTIGSPGGPSAFASTVVCEETVIPPVDARAIPVPGPSWETETSGPTCEAATRGGERLATATGVARVLRAGKLTAKAWPGGVGHLYRRLVGAHATGYVTWVPTAAPTLAGPFVVGVYPSQAAAARAWRALGGAGKVTNDVYLSGIIRPTLVVAARRSNLIYVQLLEAGESTLDAFYYTMYDAITICG